MKLPTAALRAAFLCVEAAVDVGTGATLRELEDTGVAVDVRTPPGDRARYVVRGPVDVWTGKRATAGAATRSITGLRKDRRPRCQPPCFQALA
ncbi:hypothetical protein [Cognatilysobacter segetis]|uniref:hypothetical protein n=1 Tax=Cognatilysobacter segetis TaxID=2492394 RepID=UPI00106082C9|nr:hypothetical protein [Lysobacter segetis]